MALDWPTKHLRVSSLHLDPKNPRLGDETDGLGQGEIIQYLFKHDKAGEIAEMIARSGYFPNELLLAVHENGQHIIVEGNRRLAALKALREPAILAGPSRRKIENLLKSMDIEEINFVPVTIAPNRQATDRVLATRHVGSPVRAWTGENRASFILEKLAEGYTNEQLYEELGFTPSNIQEARLRHAIVGMARSLSLDDAVKEKIEAPRSAWTTTVERVLKSTVGRKALRIELDNDHGILGNTSVAEFKKGFKKLVEDVAQGRVTSRTLNSEKGIRKYFDELEPEYQVAEDSSSFVPDDIITGQSTWLADLPKEPKKPIRGRSASKTILPKDLRVPYAGTDRIRDIHKELVKLKRDEFPNAGVVLLRVFLELVFVDYLKRSGKLPEIVAQIREKNGQVQNGVPYMRDMASEMTKMAQARLERSDSSNVAKALKYDQSARFNITDLHSFVHDSASMPTEQDIRAFWSRIEPLVRLILEQPLEDPSD